MKRFDYASVTGHDLICKKLRHAVSQNHVVNAYLFAGAPGIGKKTVARPFAASLLCEQPKDGAPCGECTSCRLFAAGNHPDYKVITKPTDKKTIGVDLVREQIVKEVYIRPFTASRKVFLIENGELLTPEAQNALLKILEEPPEYVFFIIAADSQNHMLETVLSRSLKLQFLPLSASCCRSYFAKLPSGTPERRTLAAAFAQGNIGRGKKMLEDDAFYELYQSTAEQISRLPQDTSALLAMQQFLTANKEQIQTVVEFMLIFLQDALHQSLRIGAPLLCADRADAVNAFCSKADAGSIIRVTEAFVAYQNRLQKNANFTIAGLELLTRIQEEFHD